MTLLKRDRLGRSTVDQASQDKLITLYKASGISAAQFAREHGIAKSTFLGWLKRRRTVEGAKSDQAFTLVEVEAAPAHRPHSSLTSTPLTVTLKSGATFTVHNQEQMTWIEPYLR